MLRHRFRFKLRFTITLLIVMITVSVALVLTALNYYSTRRSLHAFTQVLLGPMATLVSEKTGSYLLPLQQSTQLFGEQTASGALDAQKLDRVESALFSSLLAHPDFFYVEFSDLAGRFLMVMRRPDGSLWTKIIAPAEDVPDGRAGAAMPAPGSRSLESSGPMVSRLYQRVRGAGRHNVSAVKVIPGDSYDPHQRPWYKGALARKGVYWTDVYVHGGEESARPVPVIGAALALRDPAGKPAGVVSVNISLQGLSDFLTTIPLGHQGQTFVCDTECNLVGLSGIERLLQGRDQLRLPKLADLRIGELRVLSDMPAFRATLSGWGDAAAFSYELSGKRFLCAVQPVNFPGAPHWVVGAVLSEDEYLGDIRRGIARDVVYGLAILFLTILLGFFLARSIASPLHDIAEETRLVRNLEFGERELPPSRFEEIAEINDAYRQLKRGLRAFEKYVPTKLVRQLLEAGGDPQLGGRICELTLFFSDIEGFTTLSEATPPEALAQLLGQYFQMMSDQVSSQGGTIDKYVGDGIMAFWNAPRPDEAHAYHGVMGALLCRDAIARLPQAKDLHTRIGIHTAHVMVGNFGSLDRFAYTALGDGVNLAARLEGVNKQYGTDILVSDATYEQVKDRIVCRRLDRIAVKGKHKGTEIYEVLGEVGKVDAALLRIAQKYEEGLTAYFAGDFPQAIAAFAAVLAERPQDRPAEVMLGRARLYAETPPPPEWRGVFELKSK